MTRCPHCNAMILDRAAVRREVQAAFNAGELTGQPPICEAMADAWGRMRVKLSEIIFALDVSTYCACASETAQGAGT